MGSERMEQERRSYYRLEDRIYLQYRSAEVDEIKRGLARQQQMGDQTGDFNIQMDLVSRQLSTLRIQAQKDSPAIGQYLDLLNRKIDLLASMMVFENLHRSVGSEDGLVSTRSADISEGGVSFYSKTALAKDSYLALKLVVIGARIGIDTFGKVVSCQEEKGDKSRYRVGVKFIRLSDGDRRILTRYILDRQREMIRKRPEMA